MSPLVNPNPSFCPSSNASEAVSGATPGSKSTRRSRKTDEDLAASLRSRTELSSDAASLIETPCARAGASIFVLATALNASVTKRTDAAPRGS